VVIDRLGAREVIEVSWVDFGSVGLGMLKDTYCILRHQMHPRRSLNSVKGQGLVEDFAILRVGGKLFLHLGGEHGC
jgi:hypothetical protein